MSPKKDSSDWREKKPIWQTLPNEIAYLKPYADRYGIIQFEEDIEEYYRTIDKDELDELKSINKKSKKDSKIIDEYIQEYFVTKDSNRSRPDQ